MATIKKSPAVRFKGFEEEWEEKKLEEIIDLNSGRDYKHLFPGNIPVYGTGGYMLSVNEALSHKENAIGIGRKGTIDKPYILYAPFWTVDTLFFAIPKPKNDLNFIYSIFQRINWKQKDESTGVPSLSKISINGSNVVVVSIVEQTQIGNYFKELDGLIQLQEQKLEKVTNLKKAMLEKMFPKENADVPEIRFEGFTEKWVKKKLGEESDLLTGNPFESKKFVKKGFLLVRGMNVKRGHLDVSEDISEYWPTSKGLEHYLLEENDIVIQMDGALIGKSYAKVSSKNLPALLVQRVTRVRNSKVNSEFIYQKIQRDFLNYISKSKTETAVPHLSLNDIRNFEIDLPSTEEQQKIGEYFQSLDQLVSQSQQKTMQLKHLKQALLQKMFI